MSRFTTKINFIYRFYFFKKGRVHFSLFLYLKSFVDRLNFKVKWVITFASLSILMSSSCSIFKLPTSFERKWTNPGEILRDYSANYSKLNTFKAKGRLSVQSSEFNESGTIHVTVKMPDSLRIKVEGPLGVDVANFFLDSNKYLLYLNRDEVVYEGSTDTLNVNKLLEEIIGVTIEDSGVKFQDIQSELLGMFTGAAFIDNLNLESVNFTDSAKTVNIFKVSDMSGDIMYEFPIINELLENVQIFDDNKIKMIEKSFSRYSIYNGIFIPRRIIYTFEEKSRISITYFNVQVNRSINSDEFNIDIPQELLRGKN